MKRAKIVFKKIASICIAVIMLLSVSDNFVQLTVQAAGSGSIYLELASDQTINSNSTVLSTTINLSSTTKIFIESDGRYYNNYSGGSCAMMQITVDSSGVGNSSIIDWRNTTNTAQHSFNCIAVVTLSAGTHTISLVAIPIYGTFVVGTDSNLCVMTDITVNMQQTKLNSDSQNFNFTTYGITSPTPVPHTSLLSCTVNNSAGPIIALGSARAYSSADGDRMLGIYKDGTALTNDQGFWTVNDSYSACESQSPMYTHAYINATGSHTISLDASEFPWSTTQGEDPSQYRVGADSTLVVMNGSMRIEGSSPQSTTNNKYDEWTPIGSGDGTPVPLATSYINIPSDHNGVVMFVAKTRFQGDAGDEGGAGFLWINIDGVDCGSLGVQEISNGATESQRTVCASYLAAGSNALSPGNHTIIVYAKAEGGFENLSAVKDLPLIWFDGTSGTPAQTPGAFGLSALPNGSLNTSTDTRIFSWGASTNATSYTLKVSPNSDLSNPVINQTGITSTSYTANTTLSYGDTYYWSVTAINSYGNTVAANSNFVFYTANSANLLTNPGFESGMTAWSTSGSDSDADYTDGDAYTGSNRLTHWKGTAYNVYTYQTMTGLSNGVYSLSAYVKNDYGNLGTAYMKAENYGGSSLTYNIPITAEWEMVIIGNINVTNGQCTIGFYSNSPASSWYAIDDVYFCKMTNLLSNPGFESGMTSWSTSGNDADADYTEGGAYAGSYRMTHWKGSAYNVYTYQTKTGLDNGIYTLNAWIKNDYGNLGTAYMKAENYGSNSITSSIPQTSTWQRITIDSIIVSNGQCTVGFYSNSPANSWYIVDDVSLIKK